MTTTKSYKFFDLPTVTRDFERPDQALVKRAAAFGTATLHEAAGKIGALTSAIRPMHPSFSIAGPTGEGVTTPLTFCRQRRTAVTGGGLRFA